MKNFKFIILFASIILTSFYFFSCSKENNITDGKHLEKDFSSSSEDLLFKYEKINNIQTIPNNTIKIESLIEDDELCTNAYAQICGTQNYQTKKKTITYMDCPIEVTYRHWLCNVNGEWYMSFQIIDWKPLARCNEFMKKFSELYWGGVRGSADELINKMYKYFSNEIENTYAQWLAEITNSSCSNPAFHTSFFARDCYKTCIDWVYSDDGEFNFGAVIEVQCATSCCLRTREWCVENGEVKMISETKGGLSCIRFMLPAPCPENLGYCSAACNRL